MKLVPWIYEALYTDACFEVEMITFQTGLLNHIKHLEASSTVKYVTSKKVGSPCLCLKKRPNVSLYIFSEQSKMMTGKSKG